MMGKICMLKIYGSDEAYNNLIVRGEQSIRNGASLAKISQIENYSLPIVFIGRCSCSDHHSGQSAVDLPDVDGVPRNKCRLIGKAAYEAPSMCRRWPRCAHQYSSIECGRQRISDHRRPSTRGAAVSQRAQHVNIVIRRWRKRWS